jgi:uncharacterized protein
VEVVRPSDASSFLALAGPLLEPAEARNNLILGIAGTIERRPEWYPDHRFWIVTDHDRALAAGLRTGAENLVLGEPGSHHALEILLRAVREECGEIPGLVANAPFAERAAEIWTGLIGARIETRLAEGLHELTAVVGVPRPPGRARPASREDRDLAARWTGDFWAEALPHQPIDRDRDRWIVDSRLGTADAGVWLWDLDGVPVSMAYFGDPTPTGVRIGGVYTPPDHRRHGFATALVADLSRWLLDGGRRACFLYTDLSNPTSNSIYARIGYRKVADAFEIKFSRPEP